MDLIGLHFIKTYGITGGIKKKKNLKPPNTTPNRKNGYWRHKQSGSLGCSLWTPCTFSLLETLLRKNTKLHVTQDQSVQGYQSCPSPALQHPQEHRTASGSRDSKDSMGHTEKLQNWTQQWWLTGSYWLATDTNLFYAKTNSTYKDAGLAVPESWEMIYGQRANNCAALPMPAYGTLPAPGSVSIWKLTKQIFDQICITIKFSPGIWRIFTGSLECLMLRICE